MARSSLVVFVLLLASARAQDAGIGEAPATELPPRVALNGRSLAPRTSGPFSIIVGGHLYGYPRPDHPKPAPGFVAALDRINEIAPDLFVSLGDCFYSFREPWIDKTMAAFGRLEMPVLNACGNHDVTDRAAYTARFGPTWYAFDHGPLRLIVLDTELDSWWISGEQLAFLQGQLEDAAKSESVTSVLVFGHKVIFADDERNAVLALKCNAPDTLPVNRPARDGSTFAGDIEPGLARLARTKQVFWFAGDIGAWPRATWTLFHDRDPTTGITYVATGIGAHVHDCLVRLDVDDAQRVSLSALALGPGDAPPIESFGVDFWNRRYFPDGLPAEVLLLIERRRDWDEARRKAAPEPPR